MKNFIKRFFYHLCITLDKMMTSSRGHILMYHSFALSDIFFNVPFSNFKEQVDYLIKHKYKIVSLEDFLERKKIKLSLRKHIVFSFDDGYSDLTGVIDYLGEKKIPASLFWSTGLPENTISLSNGGKYSILSRQQLEGLLKRHPFISLGSHGITHRELTNISDQDLSFELRQSFHDISIMPNNILVVAYPRGKYNKDVISMAKNCGYLAGCTTHEGGIGVSTPDFELPRLSIDQSVDMLAFCAKLTMLYDLYSKIRK
jgi:peptidoglycan/xylan/chitin deacetylase (PgdA/CDA1 family)